MTTEQAMWLWLKLGKTKEMHLERHENLVASGAPDVWGYHMQGSFWLELKQSDGPKKSTSKAGIKVRPSQKIWFKRQTKLGCRTHWFLVQINNQKYLVPGTYAADIDEMPVENFAQFNVSNLTSTEILEKSAKGF